MMRSRLLGLGLFSARRTPDSDIARLLKKLRPLDCGRNLIRIGSKEDGGYLLPDDLDGIQYCFSPGVSNVADFENQLADRGIRSFLADYSVDGPPHARPEFTFDKKFLGASDRGEHITLSSWKNNYLPDYTGDLILQMDIEGSEYEVIFNASEDLLKQFRMIVVEFHWLDRLFDPFGYKLISSCFDKLLHHFHVAHIHPNNVGGSCTVGKLDIPGIMEFTFYNKRRVTVVRPQQNFPHPLDADNIPAPPLPLPECWYRMA